jgi:hypothetical protein
LAAVIVGAGYRSLIIQQKFDYPREALGHLAIMASNYGRAPGLYNWDEYMLTRERPEEYVYRIGRSDFVPKSPSNSEIGWPLILRLLLRDNIEGLTNVALEIVRHQLMVDLLIILAVFWITRQVVGTVGGIVASFLYAVFKIPMLLVSNAYYYYWTIPFSVLGLIFWTVVYGRERVYSSVKLKYLSFFVYGLTVGFATFLRLYFMFLPVFMFPLVVAREKNLKRALLLFAVILLGQAVFLAPQVAYNKKYFDRYAVSTRGHWHLFIQGLGFRENPWGIKDTGEVWVNEWAMARGAPDMFKDIEEPEKWYKNKFLEMLKEHPEVFAANFLRHFKDGLTVSSQDFEFFGIVKNKGAAMHVLIMFFPFLLLSSLLFLYVLARDRFWMTVAVLAQGVYLLVVVVTWFSNYTPFIAGYIPVFVVLLSISIATNLRVLFAFAGALLVMQTGGGKTRSFRDVFISRYRSASILCVKETI